MLQLIPIHALHVAACTSQHATTWTRPSRTIPGLRVQVYSKTPERDLIDVSRPLNWLSVEA